MYKRSFALFLFLLYFMNCKEKEDVPMLTSNFTEVSGIELEDYSYVKIIDVICNTQNDKKLPFIKIYNLNLKYPKVIFIGFGYDSLTIISNEVDIQNKDVHKRIEKLLLKKEHSEFIRVVEESEIEKQTSIMQNDMMGGTNYIIKCEFKRFNILSVKGLPTLSETALQANFIRNVERFLKENGIFLSE